MSEIDLGWEDVLRRAERRPRRRLVLVGVLAAGVIGGGTAAAITLTQSASALQLPMDQIGGTTVTYVIDPHTRATVLAVGKWRRANGVCFLVPKVKAGCLRHGRRLPLLLRGGRRNNEMWLLVVRRNDTVVLLDGKGHVVARVKVPR